MMPELLSPAGSAESLRAAVQNGANAVYLGCGTFNARQGAKNFTPQSLVEAIKYCHIRGVAVHLTLNTLISDREVDECSELIRHAAEAGVDAFIVQDLGVVQLCRRIAPMVPVHGSTQMTVHSLSGVMLCAAFGMTRVVLSRELDRDEIRHICKNSPIEIENNSSTSITTFGAHINNIVRRFYHIQVMLNHNNGIPSIHKGMQNFQQFLNVRKVKPGCRLVQNINRFSGTATG